ncbi:hypothetical protein [Fundicoccus culcitae]|uniref:General stress protein 17M-like domain-containing protein n=1 Tax=Fundicoccus culcitae TaxID=2969821 RepID=A0ABY5P540_9LACT|nr:hypothetical protein [Fundicoccus culcitae]UUX33691.1 hypothetical protein NRE15_12410 [Fundicoccus culcitae]
MSNEVVFGVYDSLEELHQALDRLFEKGVTRANIKIVGEQELEKVEEENRNTAVDDETRFVMPSPTSGVANTSITGETGYNQGTLYAMPVFIPTRELTEQGVDLSEYKKDLEAGNYLLLLDEEVESRIRLSGMSEDDGTAVDNTVEANSKEGSTLDPATLDKESPVYYDAVQDEMVDNRLGQDAQAVEIIEEPEPEALNNEAAETTATVEEDTSTSDVETHLLPTAEETEVHIDADVEDIAYGQQMDEQTSDVEPHHIPTTNVDTEEPNTDIETPPSHEEVVSTLGDEDTTVGNVTAEKQADENADI